RIEAKMNYGWPEIEGSDQQKGMESPLYTSGKSKTWAPSGIALKDKKLYVATLRGESLLEFNLQTDEIKTIVGNLGRIRDVLIVEDKLYFITNNTDGRGNPDQN